MRRRSEVLKESQQSAAAPAQSKFVKCGSCNVSQIPQADGKCVACGEVLGKVAEGTKEDPWALKPESQRATVPASADIAPGVMALELKRRGFDVTLAEMGGWSEGRLEQVAKFFKGEREVPEWLAPKLVGKGNVAGATSRDSEMPIAQLCQALESQGVFISVPEMAKRTVEERAKCAEYAVGQSPIPRFLAAFRKKPQTLADLPLHRQVTETTTPADDVLAKAKTIQREAVEKVQEAERAGGWAPTKTKDVFDPASGQFHAVAVVDEVTVHETWGEEKYGGPPNSFSTCTVGPFYETATVPVADAGMVREAMRKRLEAHAAEQRVIKLANFVAAVKQLREQF